MTLAYLEFCFIHCLYILLYKEIFIYHGLALQVMAFGSTPLKTYLPDGDIDLTVLTSRTDVECLASSICSVLEVQSYYGSPIMDVQYVNAQVLTSPIFCLRT